MWKTWGTSVLQRMSDHQRPSSGSQGYRPYQKKSGVIDRSSCGKVDCNDEYIGESSKTFGGRFKENLRPPPPFMIIVTPQVIQ